MENKEKKKVSGGTIILIIIASFLAAFIVYYSVMSILGPSRKIKEIEAEYGEKLSESSGTDKRFATDSSYINLLKERAFLQSRITMAANDSIYITLDIPDSTANLEISGVVVHSAKMKKIRVSKILSSGNKSVIYSMLSTPMNIMNDFASLKKVPLMIKMAPKDTSEYKPDIIPDTADRESVNYILEMNNGIRIFMYQAEDTTSTGRKNHFLFNLNDRLKNTLESLKSVMAFKVPEYHPFIKIELPKSDAKILYRAVPRNGQIAVLL